MSPHRSAPESYRRSEACRTVAPSRCGPARTSPASSCSSLHPAFSARSSTPRHRDGKETADRRRTCPPKGTGNDQQHRSGLGIRVTIDPTAQTRPDTAFPRVTLTGLAAALPRREQPMLRALGVQSLRVSSMRTIKTRRLLRASGIVASLCPSPAGGLAVLRFRRQDHLFFDRFRGYHGLSPVESEEGGSGGDSGRPLHLCVANSDSRRRL